MKTLPLSKQQGFTLLEILVSLVVSLIAIMTMVGLYQMAGPNSLEMKQGADIDSQLQLGLIAADKMLQNAGYVPSSSGVEAAYNTDLRLYKNTTTSDSEITAATLVSQAAISSSGVRGDALIWHSVIAGVDQYQGLYAPATGGLYQISGASMDLLTGHWRLGVAIIPPAKMNQGVFANVGVVTLSLSAANCTPFQMSMGGVSGIYALTINATRYAGTATQQSATCLINFQ